MRAPVIGNKSSALDKHSNEAGDAENQAGDFHGERRKTARVGGLQEIKVKVEGRLWETLGFIATGASRCTPGWLTATQPQATS